MQRIFLLKLFVCSVLCFVGAKELPSFIEKCSRKDPEKLEQCLLQRVVDLKPRLLNGIPELKLPSIEPLHVPKLEIHTGSRSSVFFDAVLTDLTIHGLKNFTVSRMLFNFDTKQLLIGTKIPKLTIQGTYSATGKVLLFEINAKGLMDATVINTDSTTYMNYTLVTENGNHYIDLGHDYKLDFKYEKIDLYFHDMFQNNPELTKQVNTAINDNIDSLSKEVNPFIFEVVHLLVVGIVNPVFRDFSVEELFLD